MPASLFPSTRRPTDSFGTILPGACALLLLCLVGLAGCAGQTSAPPVQTGDSASARGTLPSPSGQSAAMYRISDVHFNPFFGCSEDAATCKALVDELFDASSGTWRPGTSWGAIFARFCSAHPSYAQCEFQMARDDRGTNRDTNWFVFDRALQSAAAVSPKPGFVIYTGDFLAHEFRDRYDDHSGRKSASDEALFDAFVDQTILFVASEMRGALGVEIYAALGNNDAYCGDYRILPGSGFLHESARTWTSQFAPFQAGQQANFEKGGYYRVDLQPAHRTLVLNTVIYTDNALGKNSYFPIRCEIPGADKNGFDAETFDVTRPPWAGLTGSALRAKLRSEKDTRGNAWIDTQFGWLIDELVDAETAGEVAWLAAHVPPGLDGYSEKDDPFLSSAANENFARLLSDSRFTPAIAGVLAAHTHENEHKISRTQYRDRAGGFVLISPAIDSDHGNQPAYQVHEYDPQSLAILDYTTYSTLDGTSWPATANFQDLYGWAIYQYTLSERCVDGGRGPVDPSKVPLAGVNRSSLSELFDAMLVNCDATRDKYGCSYASLAYQDGGCSKLPQWCGSTGQAYQVSVADLLGTFPRACRP